MYCHADVKHATVIFALFHKIKRNIKRVRAIIICQHNPRKAIKFPLIVSFEWLMKWSSCTNLYNNILSFSSALLLGLYIQAMPNEGQIVCQSNIIHKTLCVVGFLIKDFNLNPPILGAAAFQNLWTPATIYIYLLFSAQAKHEEKRGRCIIIMYIVCRCQSSSIILGQALVMYVVRQKTTSKNSGANIHYNVMHNVFECDSH